MKPNGEIPQRGHAPGSFRLADAALVLVVGFVPGKVELVFDSPMFPVVFEQIMWPRPLRVSTGDSADDLLGLLPLGFAGSSNQEDLGSEGKVDFGSGDFFGQNAVGL
ncbi:MAG: hypothetical protein JJU29_23315 [Verrucomicrobia bacterium]|nr:hypothetical protein [Verrucomicrobiota bacterium]MCH8514679.1 hypothetical protein [Kiritimatiellia bacterium]